ITRGIFMPIRSGRFKFKAPAEQTIVTGSPDAIYRIFNSSDAAFTVIVARGNPPKTFTLLSNNSIDLESVSEIKVQSAVADQLVDGIYEVTGKSNRRVRSGRVLGSIKD